MKRLSTLALLALVGFIPATRSWTQQVSPVPPPAQTGPVAPKAQTPSPTADAPPVPSSRPATPAKAASVSPDYVIGAGDSLEINVWKEPTISGTLPVRPDGMISLALVGDLPAAGMTPMQLSTSIGDHLKKYINDPAVTVTVLGVGSQRIYMLGEIGKPGEMPLTPGLTPLQAIASAGGLSPYANAKRIYILRTVGGKQQKINFDYKKAVKDGNLQGVTLASGDTIVVP